MWGLGWLINDVPPRHSIFHCYPAANPLIDGATVLSSFISYFSCYRILVLKLHALKSRHAHQVFTLMKVALIVTAGMLVFMQMAYEAFLRFSENSGIWVVVITFVAILNCIIIRGLWRVADNAKNMAKRAGNDVIAQELLQHANRVWAATKATALQAVSVLFIIGNALLQDVNSPFGIAGRKTHQVLLCCRTPRHEAGDDFACQLD